VEQKTKKLSTSDLGTHFQTIRTYVPQKLIRLTFDDGHRTSITSVMSVPNTYSLNSSDPVPKNAGCRVVTDDSRQLQLAIIN